MPGDESYRLWPRLSNSGSLAARFISDATTTVPLSALERGSVFGKERDAFHGRSVLLAPEGQLEAALGLIELDGIARRIVLCPPGLPSGQIDSIAKAAAADIVLSGGLSPQPNKARPPLNRESQDTEWVLLTSGTTGVPKLVVHSLSTLAGPARPGTAGRIWSTFYDIRRYGGLSIFFRALLGGGSLVLSDSREDTGAFLDRIATQRVTHISGTPSHWRRALMSTAARAFTPDYVRLSGEAADQPLLNQLRAFWPDAALLHAFATTEAGFAFEVNDGFAGFPASLVGRADRAVRLDIRDGSLRIRSPYMAMRYLGEAGAVLTDPDGFIDTRDLVEREADRYRFIGRSDGIINVGGLKIHPEKVEAIINAHPCVRMSLVKARRSSITGALVVADVVCTTNDTQEALADDILAFCRSRLPRHEVPVSLRFVDQISLGPNGKLSRTHA